ncbi:putative protein with domain of unknown function (DUF1768) [Lyophyllum shimeji]|uniref:NADAR domain-containing protein n=1 Tax=Lyophyllum shimeji TaxID=47721 RepID=A0A9P3PEV4_LYOSH|nr:putative protein with domain of unknown function (DUF1768) [Lyophyllum shimeji]
MGITSSKAKSKRRPHPLHVPKGYYPYEHGLPPTYWPQPMPYYSYVQPGYMPHHGPPIQPGFIPQYTLPMPVPQPQPYWPPQPMQDVERQRRRRKTTRRTPIATLTFSTSRNGQAQSSTDSNASPAQPAEAQSPQQDAPVTASTAVSSAVPPSATPAPQPQTLSSPQPPPQVDAGAGPNDEHPPSPSGAGHRRTASAQVQASPPPATPVATPIPMSPAPAPSPLAEPQPRTPNPLPEPPRDIYAMSPYKHLLAPKDLPALPAVAQTIVVKQEAAKQPKKKGFFSALRRKKSVSKETHEVRYVFVPQAPSHLTNHAPMHPADVPPSASHVAPPSPAPQASPAPASPRAPSVSYVPPATPAPAPSPRPPSVSHVAPSSPAPAPSPRPPSAHQFFPSTPAPAPSPRPPSAHQVVPSTPAPAPSPRPPSANYVPPSTPAPAPSPRPPSTRHSVAPSRRASVVTNMAFDAEPEAELPAPIYFNQDTDYAPFLNHSPHKVSYERAEYPTATHLLEAFKFMPLRPDIAETIRLCEDTADVYEISAENAAHQSPNYGPAYLEMMETVAYLKFNQHADLRDLLLSTENAPLVYDDPSDSYWGTGVGINGASGQNELGHVLERVRERLRQDRNSRLTREATRTLRDEIAPPASTSTPARKSRKLALGDPFPLTLQVKGIAGEKQGE